MRIRINSHLSTYVRFWGGEGGGGGGEEEMLVRTFQFEKEKEIFRYRSVNISVSFKVVAMYLKYWINYTLFVNYEAKLNLPHKL